MKQLSLHLRFKSLTKPMKLGSFCSSVPFSCFAAESLRTWLFFFIVLHLLYVKIFLNLHAVGFALYLNAIKPFVPVLN